MMTIMRIHLLLFLALAMLVPGSMSSVEASKPNVLLFLVDDLGVHDIGIEGSTYYQTPNIDRLARGGIRFTQGYANCRVCSPSRASIQLGKFTARHGITQWIGAKSGMAFNRGDRVLSAEYEHALPQTDVTLAEAFSEGGYQTFFAGKWHLGDTGSLPTDHGFNINIGGHHRGSPPGGYFSPYRNPLMEDGPPGELLTLRLAKETAEFISQPHDRPFFSMLSFYTVHGPIQSTKPLWQKYQQQGTPVPQGGERFKVDRTLPVRQVQDHPVYAGMMESLDQAVGMVLTALEQSGKADDTIVIFTSDNGGVSSGDGYSTSNLPLRGGKGRQWEGGIREPYYIRYPKKIQPGQTDATPVTGADLYPTLLELCGLPLKPNQHVDGQSLVPIMNGQPIDPRPLYWHYPHYDNQGGEPSSLLRDGDWKLIHYYEDGRSELYNLANDPGEQTDLAGVHPERSAAMTGQLLSWLKDVGARFPELDPRFDPQKYAQRLERARTSFKTNLEARQAAMHDSDWQPNPTWWGSLQPKD